MSWTTLCLAALVAADMPPRYPRPDLLVEPAELTRPAVARQYRILDARPHDRYQAGHIPRAVWVDHDTWSKAFAAAQDRRAWEKRVGALGITADTKVVVYDDNSAKDAARVWWILRYWGVRDVRLLNGGWKAWQAGGWQVSEDEPPAPAVTAKLTPHPERLATKAQLLEWVKQPQVQVLDARSTGEYCGTATTAKRNGAVPGAVHQEWSEVIDPNTQRFKDPRELARLFREKKIAVNRPSVTYCQSGGRASVLAFALELMGGTDVRNYYRSWAEWGNAEGTPVVKPTPKAK